MAALPDRASSSGSHSDLPRLGTLDLRELEPQHAIAEVRVDLRLIDRFRERELAEERAGLVLSQHVHLARCTYLRRHATFQGQDAVAKVDLELIRFDAKQIGRAHA